MIIGSPHHPINRPSIIPSQGHDPSAITCFPNRRTRKRDRGGGRRRGRGKREGIEGRGKGKEQRAEENEKERERSRGPSKGRIGRQSIK